MPYASSSHLGQSSQTPSPLSKPPANNSKSLNSGKPYPTAAGLPAHKPPANANFHLVLQRCVLHQASASTTW